MPALTVAIIATFFIEIIVGIIAIIASFSAKSSLPRHLFTEIIVGIETFQRRVWLPATHLPPGPPYLH